MMVSIGTMVKDLANKLETGGLSDWEQDFTTSMIEKTNGGKVTSHLTEKQVEKIEQIYQKHFQ